MVKPIIDNEHTFIRSLKQGINLFVGSGFSTLAKDVDSHPLPTGGELAKELITLFGLPEKLDLGQACTILESINKEGLYDYLKRRFTVESYDPRYKALEKVELKKIFTTNIDDLIYKIFLDSDRYYINDVNLRGPSYSDKNAIDFTALHGSVKHDDKPMVFSTVDLASAFTNNTDDFRSLRDSVQNSPTLFIGYSFSDSSVIQALYPHHQSPNYSSRWIVLRGNDEASIQYFRALGMSIIISDTESLMEYILDSLGTEAFENEKTSMIKFPDMQIPNLSAVTVRSLKSFYLGQAPLWSDIFSNRIYKTSHYSSVVNLVDSGANIIVTGTPASGKTTLMMQVANEYKTIKNKFVTDSLSEEKAKLIIKGLKGEKAIIFVDDISNDIDAFNLLSKTTNIQLVGFERDYILEGISHKIHRGTYQFYNITDLTEMDIQQIYSRIPEDIRRRHLKRAENHHNQRQKISLFEFVELNVSLPNVRNRVRSILNQLEDMSEALVDFLVMCCYCHACRTTVSFDMAFAFLRDDVSAYAEVYDRVNNLGKLLIEDFNYISDETQDYFAPRSTIFSEAIMEQVSSPILRRVFNKFHKNVSPFRIVKYHEFKRNAYDHKYFTKAFPNWLEGKEFYEYLHEREGTPFILQQGALYLAGKRKFTEAFKWIDMALSESKSKIFSIRNSHAIILFDANINKDDQDQTVRQTLDESMSILKMCYEHDKRKMYHAIKFAEQSIEYYGKYGDGDAIGYLEVALGWLQEEERNASWNRKIRILRERVERLLN